jgi:hypothetical protein
MPRVFELSALLLAGGVLAGGCLEDSGGTATQRNVTLIAVKPADFLGKVPCVDAEGAMRIYVATAYDVTEGALEGSNEPIVLPSSPPTQCHQTVAFGFVAPLHDYAVRVEGYDTADIHPLERGSPVMLDSEGRFVAPRWTSFCSGSRLTAATGDAAAPDAGADLPDSDADLPDSDADLPDSDADPADGAAEAETPDAAPDSPDATLGDAGGSEGAICDVDPLSARGHGVRAIRYFGAPGLTRHASACTPLCDRGSPTATGMVVRISDALAGLTCGGASGEVETFNVVPENRTLSVQNDVVCTGEARYEGLVADETYGFVVTAFEAGNGAPRWGTRCAGVALPGAVAAAHCPPLSTTGSLELDVAGLLSQNGLSCGEVGRISATLSGEPTPRTEVSTPPGCPPIRFSNLPFGLHIADVSIELADAGPPRTARCEAVVLPGNSITAKCF